MKNTKRNKVCLKSEAGSVSASRYWWEMENSYDAIKPSSRTQSTTTTTHLAASKRASRPCVDQKGPSACPFGRLTGQNVNSTSGPLSGDWAWMSTSYSASLPHCHFGYQ